MSDAKFKKYGLYNVEILIDYCSENNLKLSIDFNPEKDSFDVIVTQDRGWVQSWIYNNKYDMEALVKELHESRTIFNGPF